MLALTGWRTTWSPPAAVSCDIWEAVKHSYASAQGSNYARRRDPTWDCSLLLLPAVVGPDISTFAR